MFLNHLLFFILSLLGDFHDVIAFLFFLCVWCVNFFYVCYRNKLLLRTIMSFQLSSPSQSFWQKEMEIRDRKVDLSEKGNRLPLQPRVGLHPPDLINPKNQKLLLDLVALLDLVVDVGEELEVTIPMITTRTTRPKMTMKKRKRLTKTTTWRKMTKMSKLLSPKFRLDLRIRAVLQPKVKIGTLTKL